MAKIQDRRSGHHGGHHWALSENDVEHWFEDFFGRPFYRRRPLSETEWTPSMEMFVRKDEFVIRVELPGIRKEDVDISVLEDTLTIKGKKETGEEVKEGDYYFSEASYGNFSRTINLPRDADATKVEAQVENGVLEITMPKRSEARVKKIPVKEKTLAEGKKSRT